MGESRHQRMEMGRQAIIGGLGWHPWMRVASSFDGDDIGWRIVRPYRDRRHLDTGEEIRLWVVINDNFKPFSGQSGGLTTFGMDRMLPDMEDRLTQSVVLDVLERRLGLPVWVRLADGGWEVMHEGSAITQPWSSPALAWTDALLRTRRNLPIKL